MEPLRIREVAKFGRLGDPGHTRDSGVSRDSRESGNPEIGENRYILQKCEPLAGRTHGVPTNWEIGRLEDSGDWKVSEIGEFGRIGKFGRFGRLGYSGEREFRESGKLSRVGDSGDWEKSPYVAKMEILLEPRRTREFGRFGRLGHSRDRKNWGGGEESGELRLGRFWRKSLYMAKIENLFERQRAREIGKLGNSGDSGEIVFLRQKCETLTGRAFGKPTNWEIGSLGDSEAW